MKTDLDGALAETRAKVERHFPQFLEYVDAQNELIASGACLLTGTSYREDYEQYMQLVAHVEQLWDGARTLHQAGLYAQSLFLAVSCLEETGKVGVARFQMILRQMHRDGDADPDVIEKVRRKRNPFYSHPQKHLLVAGAGAIVNSRLDRILGRKRVSKFLEDARSGSVERLRQSALYADLGELGPVLPAKQISPEQACFYVVLAGELMAEILGFEPSEWARLLSKVQAFEQEIGYPWE